MNRKTPKESFNEAVEEAMDKYKITRLKAKRMIKNRLMQGDISEI